MKSTRFLVSPEQTIKPDQAIGIDVTLQLFWNLIVSFAAGIDSVIMSLFSIDHWLSLLMAEKSNFSSF